jgi:hypothetical protein
VARPATLCRVTALHTAPTHAKPAKRPAVGLWLLSGAINCLVCAVLRKYQRHVIHDSSDVPAIVYIVNAQRATAGRSVGFAGVGSGCRAVARHNVAVRAAAGVAAVLPQGADVCVTSTLTVLDVFAFLRPENDHATSCSAAHDTRGSP